MFAFIKRCWLTLHNTMQVRIAVGVTGVLVLFMCVATLVLSELFYSTLEQGVKARLEASLYGLMGVAEPGSDDVLNMPSLLPESAFNQLNTGVFAWAEDAQSIRWRSASALGQSLPEREFLPSGVFHWDTVRASGRALWVLSFGTTWNLPGQTVRRYQFSVAQDQAPFLAQVSRFKTRLLGSFLGMTFMLGVIQLLFLRWGFGPLKQLAKAIESIESGKVERILGRYPQELEPVVQNFNSVIDSEKKQRERYRNTLADLAHSLKTPLTVLKRLPVSSHAEAFSEQIERMDHIIQYHLKRSVRATAVQKSLATPLFPILEKTLAALEKVYKDKAIVLTVNQTEPVKSACVGLETADLFELLGNILDNAFKYAKHSVEVDVQWHSAGLELVVEDDGPGIAALDARRVLERGLRLDEQGSQGQGIGLSVVQDICEVYHLRLGIGASQTHGGARVSVLLPSIKEVA